MWKWKGNPSFGSVKRSKRANRWIYGCIKSRKRSILWLITIWKTMHLQQLREMQSSKQGLWEGYHLSIEGIRKGYLFLEKWKIKVGPRGRASPYKHLLSTTGSAMWTFEQIGPDDLVCCVTYQIAIRKPKPCDINPCEHGGTCMNDGNSFKCVCPKGYTGPTCAQGK